MDETGKNQTQVNPQVVKKGAADCTKKGEIENNRNVILDGIVQKVFTEEVTGKLKTKEC